MPRGGRRPRVPQQGLCWALAGAAGAAVAAAGVLGSLAFAAGAGGGRPFRAALRPPAWPRAAVPAARGAKGGCEALPSAAERRFARLRLSVDLEEILGRVPQLKACSRPQLGGCVLVARLGLNFATLCNKSIFHAASWRGGPVALLPWVEFILYTGVILSAIWGLSCMRGLDPSLGYIPRNNLRWRRAARGALRLQWAAGFSTLKLLDGFRSALPEMKAAYEEHFATRSERHRPHTALGGVFEVLRRLVGELAKGVVGLLALSAKLAQFDGSVLQLLGLANQVIHITEASAIEKAAVETFVFTGKDAKWSAEEADALREFEGRVLKRCVRHTGGSVSGVAAFTAINAADLQQLVITEVED